MTRKLSSAETTAGDAGESLGQCARMLGVALVSPPVRSSGRQRARTCEPGRRGVRSALGGGTHGEGAGQNLRAEKRSLPDDVAV